MSYRTRVLSLAIFDSVIVLFSIYLSHFFLNPYAPAFNDEVYKMIFVSSLVLLASHHTLSYFMSLYRRAWRYASIEELAGIIAVVTASIFITGLVQMIFFHNLYQRGLIVTFMLHILLIGGVRFAWRYFSHLKMTQMLIAQRRAKRTLIVGAGSAGRMIARQLKENNKKSSLVPVAFIDDDPHLKKLKVAGINVQGSIDDLEKIVHQYKIEHIILAIPSLDQNRLNQIITKAKRVCDNVQILPKIEDLVTGKISINQIRDVSIEDLLGREPVELDIESIQEKIKGQTVLVTGAGGSIGSELCRQICRFHPERIVLLGHGEFSIYSIERELKDSYKTIDFPTEIADIQDRDKMFKIMKQYNPSFVYHAAAHKHVPLMERNPEEAVKNNIYGTKNVAEAADFAGVDTFVMISTDKAVNPTSVMGATKRIAEMVVQFLDRTSQTRFVAVRFGNVLGSRGSVIPLFKEQIRKGGPITITHPDMTRYFMTIPEASRLVIQASALARGGEIFVLDMGEPVKILDLAKNLIRLSGFTEDEIKIEFTGIRPGEKLYEELLGEEEVYKEQIYPDIYIGKSVTSDVGDILNTIKIHLNDDKERLKNVLLSIARDSHRKALVN